MKQVPLPFSNRSAADWILHFQRSEAAEERVVALQAIQSLCSTDDIFRCGFSALSDPDPTVRALAAKLFRTSKIPVTNETVDRWAQLLTDEDPDVRFEVARALIRSRPDEAEAAVKVLCNFLDVPETHPLMVAAVVTAVTEATLAMDTVSSEVAGRLRRFITHERAEVRESVASAFAKWPSLVADVIEALLPLLDDPEPIVRERIAAAFGDSKIDNPSVRLALQAATTDEDSEVARHAVEALKKLERD